MQASSSNIPFQVTHGCLVAAFHGVIDDSQLGDFQNRILREVKTTMVKGVVLDVSQLQVIDDISFGRLIKVSDSLKMLGSTVTYCGFQPPVVAALVHFDADITRVQAFYNLESAISYLNDKLDEQVSGTIEDEDEDELEKVAEVNKPDE
jgi:anti-anti-sigma regulatory factor